MATSILVSEITETGRVLENPDGYAWIGRAGNEIFLGLYAGPLRYGSRSSFNIEGTDSSDNIFSYGYEDGAKAYIEAGDGDDTYTMYGNTTARFYGGSGNDHATIDSTSQKQYLFGEDGNDTLISSNGDDVLMGGEGHDYIVGGGGNDIIGGGSGTDWLQGGSGNDYLTGAEGNDYLEGGDGADTLIGGAGHDWLTGGSGSDTFDQRDQKGSLQYTGISDFSFEEGDKIRVNADSLHGIPFNGSPQVTNYQPGNSVLAVRVTTEDNSFLVWGFDTNTFNSEAAFEIM